jgi:hypothetical protein
MGPGKTYLSVPGTAAAGGGVFRGGGVVSAALNERGDVAFVADVEDVGPNLETRRGLFLYRDGVGTELVVRTGLAIDSTAGPLTVSDFDLAGIGSFVLRHSESDGLSDDGAVAFWFDSVEGPSGIAVYGAAVGGCNAADLAEPFGALSFADIAAFLGAYTAQDGAADLAAPFGVFSFADITAFLGAYSAGCG